MGLQAMEALFLFGPSLILSVTIVLALWEEGRPPRRRRLKRHRSPGPLKPADSVVLREEGRAIVDPT
jgi:hypothetical protein